LQELSMKSKMACLVDQLFLNQNFKLYYDHVHNNDTIHL
jgi:hypothetical protein